MKKKALVLFFLVLMCASLFAAKKPEEKKMAVGGSVGFPFIGAVFDYKFTDDWNLTAGLGYALGFYDMTLLNERMSLTYNAFDVQAYSGYSVYKWDFGEGHILRLTAGGQLDFMFGSTASGSNPFTFVLGIQAVPGLEYRLPNPDCELLFYFRVPLGLGIVVVSNRTYCSFVGGAASGILWRF